MDILTKFCAREADHGLGIGRPFSQGGHTYATNGFIAVRVPRIAEVQERQNPVMSSLPWDHATLNYWSDLPDYDLSKAEDCPRCQGTGMQRVCHECDGVGEVELASSFNTYTVECRTCRGSGVVKGDAAWGDSCAECQGTGKDLTSPVPWGGGHISMGTLERIRSLPGIHLSRSGDGLIEPFRFVFDGGEGLAMPVRG